MFIVHVILYLPLVLFPLPTTQCCTQWVEAESADRMLQGITTPTIMALQEVVGATMQGAHRHPGIIIIIHLVVLGRPQVSVTLRLLSTT